MKIDENTAANLNELVSGFYTGNLNKYSPAIFTPNPEIKQGLNLDVGKFNFVEVKASGRAKSFIPYTFAPQRAVWRGLIGYPAIEDLGEDKSQLIFHLSHMINNGLYELTQVLGNLSERNVRLGKLGEVGVVFEDNPEQAGFEVNIYVL